MKRDLGQPGQRVGFTTPVPHLTRERKLALEAAARLVVPAEAGEHGTYVADVDRFAEAVAQLA